MLLQSLSNKLTQLSDASAARVREVHATFDQLFALLQCRSAAVEAPPLSDTPTMGPLSLPPPLRKLTVLKELAEAASSYEEPVLEVVSVSL